MIKEKSGQTGVIILLIILLVFVGVALFFLIGGGFSFTGGSVFNRVDCRDVVVPYQEREIVQNFLEADVIDTGYETRGNSSSDSRFYTRVDLRNVDNEPGWFKVTFNYQTLKDGKRAREVRHYIEPDEVVSFEYEYDIDFGEDIIWTYSFKSEPIESVKLVTKYRTERRCDDNSRY